MSDILAELITPQVKFTLMLIVVCIVVLYIVSIVWTVRDAYMRGSYPWLWGIVAAVPLLGVIIYCLLRPAMYVADREEQDLDILLRQRQLNEYGECPYCGYPTEKEFVICPSCHRRLKNECSYCKHALEPEWTVCPYCRTKVSGGKG